MDSKIIMDTPRIIFYYQTFSTLKPILYSGTPVTHIHLSAIHFGMDNNLQPYIHLNDDSPYSEKFDSMWEEIEQASKMGIKIILMIGGAGTAYQDLFSKFDIYYNLLYHLLKNKPFITGIDLDIEEQVSLDKIEMLITKVKTDFSQEDFMISTAPIQSSLQDDIPGMGGFVYKKLLNSNVGKYISYFNGQFYSDYSKNAYDEVVKNGYSPQKVVMGMLSGTEYQDELKKVYTEYGDKFGGVFVWEYFNSNPQVWLNDVAQILKNNLNFMNSCKIM